MFLNNLFFRFKSFIEIAGCQTQKEIYGLIDRGIVKFSDCANVKDINNESPAFYGYKCDDKNKVIDSIKYFVDANDPFLVYVTFVPNGCYNKAHYAKRDNTKNDIENYFNKNIEKIGVSNEMRLE